MGWGELLCHIKEENKLFSEEHAELSKVLSKNVVVPLKKLVSLFLPWLGSWS